MIIAIPAVTSVVDDSKFTAYVDTAKSVIDGVVVLKNNDTLKMHDQKASYYIPASCVTTENGTKSPYGEFTVAYVIVNYNGVGKENDYYWISRDEEGIGVKNPVKRDDLTEDSLTDEIEEDFFSMVPVNNRLYTIVYNEDCTSSTKSESVAVTFEFINGVQTYNVPKTGNYKLEVWGAQGGSSTRGGALSQGGKGGYASGIIYLNSGDVLYIHVGGKNGYNGGGSIGNGTDTTAGNGGGATDIRVNGSELANRVIVAGGGGGGAGTHSSYPAIGGAAGGTSGVAGTCASGSNCSSGGGGYPGTQSYGGSSTACSGSAGGLGYGGTYTGGGQDTGGGGGGGYYGGGSGGYGCSGGGGSSYVSSSMSYTEIYSGSESFLSPTGEQETGHSENGYVKISLVNN